MKLVKKNKCSGCSACYNVCPKKAIFMIEDCEGFKYPTINDNLCIDCGLCNRVCPAMNKPKAEEVTTCYVAYNNNLDARLTSSSGGIFDLLAKKFMLYNDYVAGACFDDKLVLNHELTNDINNINKLKGSKYIQSNINLLYQEIKEKLKINKVLFVGTPCQVAGLKSFLGIGDKNLYTVGIFCHGVPSNKVFYKYIHDLEYKNKKKVNNYHFRNKNFGWKNYCIIAKFDSKDYIINHKKDDFMKFFLQNIILRPSCYQCEFKLKNQNADLLIGDFWGIDNYYPYLDDDKGTSAILVNTTKGEELISLINSEATLIECDLGKIIKGNSALEESAMLDEVKRNNFFNDLDNKSISYLLRKHTRKSIYKRCLNKVRNVIEKNL